MKNKNKNDKQKPNINPDTNNRSNHNRRLCRRKKSIPILINSYTDKTITGEHVPWCNEENFGYDHADKIYLENKTIGGGELMMCCVESRNILVFLVGHIDWKDCYSQDKKQAGMKQTATKTNKK